MFEPASSSLKDQLRALYFSFKGKELNESSLLDLSLCRFVRPVTLLAISACLRDYQCKVQEPLSPKVREYLDKIHFPFGITKAEEVNMFDFNSPIGYITQTDTIKSEALERKFYQLVNRWAGNVEGVASALQLPISELVENIFQHSNKNHGWLFAQHYPKKKSFEMCILDTGRGIAGSYRDIKNLNVRSKEAIELALKGTSTKVTETGRGWGLYTSKEIVNTKLNGEFLLVTGDAALYSNSVNQSLIELPGFHWSGVIISYRIPYPVAPIDITDILR
ncbi:MAG: ATP-binding protein [Candidatus Paceibacterota bacterium]|jgi:anti-sigma regulatory factor (Ser/Thr protein kinase)